MASGALAAPGAAGEERGISIQSDNIFRFLLGYNTHHICKRISFPQRLYFLFCGSGLGLGDAGFSLYLFIYLFLLVAKQDELAWECEVGLLNSHLFLQSVPNDSLHVDEEDILKVFLIAFIERDKKKQLQQIQ